MEIKKCNECQSEVSSKSESCPQCGSIFNRKISPTTCIDMFYLLPTVLGILYLVIYYMVIFAN